MGLNLSKKTMDFLKKYPEKRFTARQIAEYIFTKYPEECKEKQEKSKAEIEPLVTNALLIQQLVKEIGALRPKIQEKNSEIKTTATRPREYYYSTLSDVEEVENIEIVINQENKITDNNSINNTKNISEYDLYPILQSYLMSDSGLYSKRINEKRASNLHGANGNKWLFPDIVAMEDLTNGWHQEIKDASKNNSDKLIRLWSFEVKIKINRSNVRETFFQAVSNSSWANFGYLVAAEIDENAFKELRILSGLHGIGFIQLNLEAPTESQILIPAKEKSEIDWNTANRVAIENPDFVDVVKAVRQFYQTGEVKEADWDKIE